jgi:hypothetical protein
MEIKGTLHKILPEVSGTGARGEWKLQSFIIKTSGAYPKEVCITAWGNYIEKIPTTIGKEVTVFVNPSSKEYSPGKYNTELQLYKVEY